MVWHCFKRVLFPCGLRGRHVFSLCHGRKQVSLVSGVVGRARICGSSRHDYGCDVCKNVLHERNVGGTLHVCICAVNAQFNRQLETIFCTYPVWRRHMLSGFSDPLFRAVCPLFSHAGILSVWAAAQTDLEGKVSASRADLRRFPVGSYRTGCAHAPFRAASDFCG